MRANISVSLIALIVAALLAPAVALATAQRTFVSTSGVDNASCSLASPCRTFDAAVGATNVSGEVIVLDSGGYGVTTITKSISIIAPPGVYAGIAVFSGQTGITVDAPGATVVLRGLSINDQGGFYGISVTNAATVQIESCIINGLLIGIRFNPVTNATLMVADTTLRNNDIGISAAAFVGADLSRVEIWRSLIEGSQHNGIFIEDIAGVSIGNTLVAENGERGIELFSTAISTTNPSVAVDRTQIVGNGLDGVWAHGDNLPTFTTANISHSVLAGNQHNGVFSSLQGSVRLSGNHITGNYQGGAVSTLTGVIGSMQSNLNSGNGSASSVPSTITPY
jgi:hypothetical protein